MPSQGPIIRIPIDYTRLLRNAHATGAATAINTQGPMIINEQWSTATLDGTNTWVTDPTGTGTVARGTNAGRAICLLNLPANLDMARIAGRRTVTNPGVSDPNLDMYQQLVLEFELLFGTVANIANVTDGFFAGLGAGASLRASQNVAGFVLVSDALNVLTDAAAAETVTVVGSSPTLTVSNLYKVVIRNGAVDFWVNKVLKVTHTANIPAVPLTFSLGATAEGATKLELGNVRMYLQDG